MNETIFEMEKEIAKLNRTIISLLPYKYSWKVIYIKSILILILASCN